jgi:isopenicillin-N N-acyltransferase like protein
MPLPPVLQVTGPPGQAGAAYGTAARDLVVANLERYRARFRDQAGLDDAAVAVAGEAFRAVTVEHHPRISAMLDGLAEGAGVPRADIYAINARTELLYGHQPALDGCTAVGVLGTHTADGHLLMAQNWDWHPDQRGMMLLLHTVDERGHTVFALTEAGMLAKAGLNGAGVGLCLNMLACDRDGLTARPGVPYHVLARAILEAGFLSRATAAVCRSPRNASVNLLLGQAGHRAHGDPAAGGELIDLELVPGDVGWLHPDRGTIAHANHLEAVTSVRDVEKDWGGSSLYRAARARRLLAGYLAGGPIGSGHLVALLRDHGGYPHAICRHVDEEDDPFERSESICSLVLDLDARRFGIAPGPPCGHEYTWYDVTGAAPAA